MAPLPGPGGVTPATCIEVKQSVRVTESFTVSPGLGLGGEKERDCALNSAAARKARAAKPKILRSMARPPVNVYRRLRREGGAVTSHPTGTSRSSPYPA